jgi:hypothetical protein
VEGLQRNRNHDRASLMPTARREKWTGETRLIWSLFAVVGTLLCVIGSLLWSQVSENSANIRHLTSFVHRSDAVHDEVLRRLERIEKVLERNRD